MGGGYRKSLSLDQLANAPGALGSRTEADVAMQHPLLDSKPRGLVWCMLSC
jgi:hypothetical protein